MLNMEIDKKTHGDILNKSIKISAWASDCASTTANSFHIWWGRLVEEKIELSSLKSNSIYNTLIASTLNI